MTSHGRPRQQARRDPAASTPRLRKFDENYDIFDLAQNSTTWKVTISTDCRNAIGNGRPPHRINKYWPVLRFHAMLCLSLTSSKESSWLPEL